MGKKGTNEENRSHKHDYPIEDVWNNDNTLAQLIVPRLQAFKALDKHWALSFLRPYGSFQPQQVVFFLRVTGPSHTTIYIEKGDREDRFTVEENRITDKFSRELSS